MKKKNTVLLLLLIFLSGSMLSCAILMDYLGDDVADSALFCILPAEIAQELAPSGLDDGGDLDNVSQSEDDPNATDDGLNSAAFMAGIVATAASQGTDLFNAVIDELSDYEDLFKDEMFLQYEKNGKYYGVRLKNESQTCYLTYGEISSKSDTDFSNGDALSRFVYDPREQDKGPNMSIILDEYGIDGKSKDNGARYLWLDIENNSTLQSVKIKAFVEGAEAEFFKGVGGKITYDKSTSLYEIEAIIKGYPLEEMSELDPKYRVYGVMDNQNAGAVTSKLEEFGLQYTVDKKVLLDALGMGDPIPFLNPEYTIKASLDYQVRNYLTMDGVPQSIDDVNIKSSVLELTRATASAESIESDTAGATEFLPSGEIDFTSALKPMLGMDPPSNESSLEYYEEITENGNWKSFTIEESSLPDASDFGEIYD